VFFFVSLDLKLNPKFKEEEESNWRLEEGPREVAL
jgi:hypothetical protein